MRNKLVSISILVFALTSQTHAEEVSTPFIDSLKKNMPQTDSSEGYAEKIQSNLEKDSSEGYSQDIQNALPPQPNANGYSERIQYRLEDKDQGGAIQALKEGRSELQLKRPGKFLGAIGFRFAFQTTSDVTFNNNTSAATGRTFDSLYGTSWDPDGQLFLEHRFYHNEQSVSLGLSATIGVAYRKTTGSFEFQPNKPGGGTYPANSNTTFEFFTVPLSIGGTLRLNTLNFIRPYVTAGPSLTYYNESRNDGIKGNQGYSYGALTTAGVNLMLDWISRSSAWDMYESTGVKHYYLSLDYSRLTTFSGDIRFNNSAIYGGLTFEL